ncbi:MAG: hypothetical protein Q8P51_06875 [Ignavibacteria bacterium]|nr:hypothetical protein [Ignavibacteria bacterium]
MTKLHYLYLGLVGLFLILSGCSTSYRIQVIDGLPKEVYLNYTKGADVKVGDIFVLYEVHRPQPSSAHQGHGGHGGGSQPIMKHEKAMVQVIRVVDELHAAVKVLSGQVEDGLEAERLK